MEDINTPYVEEPGSIVEEIDWWDLHYTSLDEQLICPICRTAFVDPYSTDCGHTFCHECIKESWNSNSVHELVCPIDRTKLSLEPHPAPFLVRSLLDELEVLCPYSHRGCDFKGKRWVIESHVAAECGFVKVRCHHPCTNHVERRKFDPADCACDPVETETAVDGSEEGGNPPIQINERALHETGDETFSDENTPEADIPLALVVKCPGHVFGCLESGDSHEALSDHVSTCALAKISSAFETQSRRMSSLESENRTLKRQMDVVQHLIRKNATELDSQILVEYERILRELRETESNLSGQQTTIASLVAENTRTNAEVNYIKGGIDSIRRQLFILNQSQRRLSFYSAFQNTSLPNGETSDSATSEETNRKRSQQKL